ncbi:MAG: peroxiredoxin [Planctomycetes bacterium]|nr:peroxiredoxin [Planctomycetota bacterium]
MSGVKTGRSAPAFALLDENDNIVKLESLRGRWVVLYFYPRDDTPGCTTEACEFTESITAFRGMDAEVVGVSPDTPEKHRKFIEKYELKIKLLSDPEHEVLKAYGAWGIKKLYGRESEGVIRSTCIIDPAGEIAFHWPQVKAAGHAEEVRAKLKEFEVTLA